MVFLKKFKSWFCVYSLRSNVWNSVYKKQYYFFTHWKFTWMNNLITVCCVLFHMDDNCKKPPARWDGFSYGWTFFTLLLLCNIFFVEMWKYTLFYLRKKLLPNTSMVICTSQNISMLYVDVVYYAGRWSSIPRPERVRLRPIGSNNYISDQSEAKRMAILSDLLLRSPGELVVNPQNSIIFLFVWLRVIFFPVVIFHERRNFP